MLQRLSRRRIGRLAADIDLLDERLLEIVSADAALAHRYRLLTSMPGVGAVLACTLIALLPELGGMSRKQVAAPRCPPHAIAQSPRLSCRMTPMVVSPTFPDRLRGSDAR